MTEAVKKSVTVPLAARDAFALFTEGLDRWWPKESHSLSASRGEGGRARVRLEPRIGGRVVETMPDGTEAPWGTVTDWEPGSRFGLDWYVGRTPEEATHVEVVFTQTEAGTRVDLTHSEWASLGSRAAEVQASYDAGWTTVLGVCFARACTGALAPAA